MPDDRIYDATNILKNSPTAKGGRVVGGPPDYQHRLRALAQSVVDELWRLWNRDEIGVADLEWGETITWADSARRWGYDIRINRKIEPSPAGYASPEVQSKLAATSLNMCHEAV